MLFRSLKFHYIFLQHLTNHTLKNLLFVSLMSYFLYDFSFHLTNTGSLYLCCAGFLPLGLPADDPFWNAPDADWTSLKLWKGIDLPADHAVN